MPPLPFCFPLFLRFLYYPVYFSKYEWLSLYYIVFEKRYSIYDGEINFLKGYGYDLIGNPDHPDGNSTDQEYFFIHDDLFGIIIETD